MSGGVVIPVVCLDSIDEVRAVHKMLFDRKFDGPEDVYFGSPFVASVQHKLADALAAAEPTKNWTAWRDAAEHPEKVEKVRRHVAQLSEWWAAAPVTKREAYVRDLFAPLLVNEELLGELTR
ncbi:hypothetical protein [Amycolatopsis magusensis]|uniref:hypothetical protein n=1 Tax=Amycolatopsis magusensis TaxID=882444 RepID=UPI0037B73436